MSKYPVNHRSFLWQRVGLVLGLSLMAVPLAPPLAHVGASADELETVPAIEETGSAPEAVADVLAATASAADATIEDQAESEAADASAAPEATPAAEAESEPAAEAPAAEAEAASEAATPEATDNAQEAADQKAAEEAVEEPSATTEGAETASVTTPAATATPAEVQAAEAVDSAIAATGQTPTVVVIINQGGTGTEDTTDTADAQQPADDTTAEDPIPDVTLVYNPNDGTDAIKTATVKNGSLELPTAKSLGFAAPEGMAFAGWYEPTSDGVNFFKAGETYKVTSEEAEAFEDDATPVALYALWLPSEKLADADLNVAKTPVFFTASPAQGGMLSDEVVFVPDSKDAVMDAVLAEPETGYQFAGWYKDGEKVSDDPLIDPTTIDGALSTDDADAAPLVLVAKFVPEGEEVAEDEAPDLSSWRDPFGKAAEDESATPSAMADNDPAPVDVATTVDTAADPTMDDPNLLDQTMLSLDDPKFDNASSPAANASTDTLSNYAQTTDGTGADGTTDENGTGTSTYGNYGSYGTTGTTSKTGTSTTGTTGTTGTTSSTTKTSTYTSPYSSYSSTYKSSGTSSTSSSTYKSPYTSTYTSTYKSSTSSTSSPYSSTYGTTGTTGSTTSTTSTNASSAYGSNVKSATLAQTGDALMPALLALSGLAVLSALALGVLFFRGRRTKA